MDDSRLRKDLQEYIGDIKSLLAVPISPHIQGTHRVKAEAYDEALRDAIKSLEDILNNNP